LHRNDPSGAASGLKLRDRAVQSEHGTAEELVEIVPEDGIYREAS
jgi:hypothetical protein